MLVATLVAAVIASGLVIAQPWSWCSSNWSDATRVDVLGSSADVTVSGTVYRIGASALLDYMPRDFSTPLELWVYQLLHGERHGLSVTASVEAISRAALGNPEFVCFRATHGGEIWARHPTTYATQTMADGHPPGAPSPVPNQAWRQASASDGPEWPAGEAVGLEVWVDLNGYHYTFVFSPFPLGKGL